MVLGISLCFGYVLKNWIKDVDNKYIPTICACLGIILDYDKRSGKYGASSGHETVD
ncbi:phage holin family protein [Lacrimispora celerecrescens]|uniref:phage holin family protein n=1 Tax=Lacrimispora celerecrescens TaxID=29354 RepID=UPI001FA88867